MTAPNEANPSWRARFVCLRATVTMSCAGLLAFAAGGRSESDFPPSPPVCLPQRDAVASSSMQRELS